MTLYEHNALFHDYLRNLDIPRNRINTIVEAVSAKAELLFPHGMNYIADEADEKEN
jgi:hypothetical protein